MEKIKMMKKLDSLIDRNFKYIFKKEHAKADITHMIKRVSNRAERTVLEKRYLCFDTWEQIFVDMGYSIQHTFRLHDKALKEIDEFLKEES